MVVQRMDITAVADVAIRWSLIVTPPPPPSDSHTHNYYYHANFRRLC